jgi:hypothetical protein
MKRNANTRKIASALWVLLMTLSPMATAMQEKGRDRSGLSRNNYTTILREIEALTTRIHREVNKVLADYRRDTEEYHRRMGGRRGIARQGYRPAQTMAVETNPIVVETRGVDNLQSLQKKVAQAGANPYKISGKFTITKEPEKGGFGVVYLENTDAVKVSNGQSLKGDRARQLGLCSDELSQLSAIHQELAPKKNRFNFNICLPHTTMRVKFNNSSYYNDDLNYPDWNIKNTWNVQIMPKIVPVIQMQDIILSAAKREEGGLNLIKKLGRDLSGFQKCFLEKNYTSGRTSKTMVHGDFSYKNILYTREGFTILDNSSMGKGRSILTDPICFIYSSVPLFLTDYRFQSLNDNNKKFLLQAFYTDYMAPFDGSVKAEIKSIFAQNMDHCYALQGTHFGNLQLNIQRNLPECVYDRSNLINYQNLYNGYFKSLYSYDDLELYGHYLALNNNNFLSLYDLDCFANIGKEVVKTI